MIVDLDDEQRPTCELVHGHHIARQCLHNHLAAIGRKACAGPDALRFLGSSVEADRGYRACGLDKAWIPFAGSSSQRFSTAVATGQTLGRTPRLTQQPRARPSHAEHGRHWRPDVD